MCSVEVDNEGEEDEDESYSYKDSRDEDAEDAEFNEEFSQILEDELNLGKDDESTEDSNEGGEDGKEDSGGNISDEDGGFDQRLKEVQKEEQKQNEMLKKVSGGFQVNEKMLPKAQSQATI